MQNPRAGTGGFPRQDPEPAAGCCQTPSLPMPIRCFISTGDSKAFPATRRGRVYPSTPVPTRPPGCTCDGVRRVWWLLPGAALSPAASKATHSSREPTPRHGRLQPGCASAVCAWASPGHGGLGHHSPRNAIKSSALAVSQCEQLGLLAGPRAGPPGALWGPWQGWTQALGKAREQGEWEQGAEWDHGPGMGPRSWDGATERGGCWGMAVRGSAGPSAAPGTRGWLEQVSGALRPCGVVVGDGAVPKHHLGAKATRDGVGASTPASALCQPRAQRCPHPSDSCPPE